MTKATISKQQATELYKNLRVISLENWKKMDSKRLSKNPDFLSKLKGVSDTAGAGIGLTVLGRAAHTCDEDQFVRSLCAGEFPPVKMSAREMEVAKGGFLLLALPAIAAIGAAVTAVLGPKKETK